jgi:hypothetical protein
MSNIFENLNISSTEYKANDFEPLPKGQYLVVITSCEERMGKTSNKPYLALSYEVLEGEYKGRKLFFNLNVFSDNPDAVRIARNELAGIAQAVSVANLKGTEDIINKPFIIKLGVKSKDGEVQNRIDKYLPATGTIGSSQVASTTTSNKKPWER